MRTYGRLFNPDGTYTWQKITTDAYGRNDYVWLTTLVQTLKLNRNESPFYANYGIPGEQSVVQQIFPDLYVAETQAQFSQYFSSLVISKRNTTDPEYNIFVTTNQGVPLAVTVPV